MPITYSVANNWIDVTGYTALVPCNFTDLYNADKAGTLSLHARVGIAGVDGAAVAVDRAERPADYIVLGGASGDLYITITNWNLMTNATIRVIGTDRDGAAQTDDVVVNANGNFNAAKWFKTITHTQVTVFNTPGGGSFDYDLTQGQWGVIWMQGATQFGIDCRLRIGPGANTWFADTEKIVEFFSTCGAGNCIYIDTTGEFRIGTLLDVADKAVSEGCALLSSVAGNHYLIFNNSGTLYLYDSFFINPGGTGRVVRIKTYTGNSRIWHCISSGITLNDSDAVDVYEVYFSVCDYAIRTSTGTFDVIGIDNCTQGIYCWSNVATNISNAIIQNCAPAVRCWAIIVDSNLTDVTSDWAFTYGGVCTHVVNRLYTFNLRVVDSDGTGINAAIVSMVDQFGAAVFSVATDANGDIVEQTILLGYYNQANGNVIQPAGSHSPHTVTISKAGYAPRTIVYTMDRAHVEVEKLGGAAPHGREYRRRRVPGEVSTMDEFE